MRPLERVGRAPELELDRRQRLAQIVVQFTGEIGALFFAGRLEAGGETPHLFRDERTGSGAGRVKTS